MMTQQSPPQDAAGLDTCAETEAHRDERLRDDLRTLARFIHVYCRHKHRTAEKTVAQLKSHDIEAIAGEQVFLCATCFKLLAHSFVKRSTCPFDPKPKCKHCPEHCYHPTYRQQIREVMKYSGTRLVLSGRLDYLFKRLF